MTYSLGGVETQGPLGVNFRSRLEARWAQFFTLAGWPWQYEPDMGFDGWIPDFGITSGGGLLVEVKPALTLDQLEPHKQRIMKSKAVAQVWLVGATLAPIWDGKPMVGWLGFNGGWSNTPGAWHWQPDTLDRVKMLIDQKHPLNFKHAQMLWVRSGNELQWRKK